MTKRSTTCALLLGCVAAYTSPGYAGQVVIENGHYRFHEDFAWSGNHAATIGRDGHRATTVWMAEDDWDARGGTGFIQVTPLTDDGVAVTNAFHVDIHKASSTDPRNGVLSNTVYALGGNGDAGIGIMHLDYQDIVSARLRNPLLISATQPGVVRFHAPLFVTTGHWWEIALTPVGELMGAEHSSVPSVESPLPFAEGDAAQPGPGSDALGPGANSLNVVAIGTADYPCRGFPGWRTRFGVSKTVAGVKSHDVTPGMDQADFLPTDPTQANTLVLWEIQFFPDQVTLAADLDGDGTVTLLESWPVTIEWPEVHLHLVGVAYQATHHPDDECNLGHQRELQWRDVSAYPVKYARTAVFPKNEGTVQVPKELGFWRIDLRDIQRTGVVDGVAQPNSEPFTPEHPGAYCRDGGFPCFSGSGADRTLSFTLPSSATIGLSEALLVSDLKDAAPASTHASVRATLNGQDLGRFPEHDSVLSDPQFYPEWVRRSVPIPPDAIRGGANTLQLTLEDGAYVDRLEIELLYGSRMSALFADGFEPSAPSGGTSRSVRRSLGALGITYPLAPVGARGHLLHRCDDD